MGIWRWIRDVIADTGEHRPVAIQLERLPAAPGTPPVYAFRLGVRAGFGGQEVARIPVFVGANPAPHPILKEIHRCEVAGRTLEAANVHALRAKVAALLETLAPARALPLCYFRAPAMDYSIPVYEQDGAIMSPVVGGSDLRGRDLAEIRGAACRWLVSAGYARDEDEITVGVLRPSDLSLVPPAAVFRSFADPDFWLPSIEGSSPDGPVVGMLGHSARLPRRERRRAGPAPRESAPAAPDVIELLRYVRAEVERSRSAGVDPATLYAAEVRPEIWADAERRTHDTGRRLVAYLSEAERTTLELPIRQTGFGHVAAALEDRGINVFIAPDEDRLVALIGRYLSTGGFLRFDYEIEVHAAQAPRPERLNADEIWTFGDGSTVSPREPEEVAQQ